MMKKSSFESWREAALTLAKVLNSCAVGVVPDGLAVSGAGAVDDADAVSGTF